SEFMLNRMFLMAYESKEAQDDYITLEASEVTASKTQAAKDRTTGAMECFFKGTVNGKAS
ncbi:hypothetical protein ACJX0J_038827, partial [Zea mays]